MAIKTCEFCGATYSDNNDGCPNCQKNKVIPIEDLNEEFEGYPKRKWHKYIDYNHERYMKVFKKHEGKKFFLSLNWSALLFNFKWMFYRRLYKIGLTYMILLHVFTIVYTLVVTLAFQGAFSNYEATSKKYNAFLNSQEYHIYEDLRASWQKWDEEGNFIGKIDDENNPTYQKYVELKSDYNSARSLKNCYKPVLYIGIIAFDIFLRLSCDWAYKRHIKKNIDNPPNGTSMGMAILAFGIEDILSRLIVIGLMVLPIYLISLL